MQLSPACSMSGAALSPYEKSWPTGQPQVNHVPYRYLAADIRHLDSRQSFSGGRAELGVAVPTASPN